MKLEIDKLAVSFDGRTILGGLSFDVADGEFVSLLGPSGCGKSTILNVLAGIVTPEGGTVRVDGATISGTSEHFAYMPQEDLLLPWKSILDNVCLYGAIHGTKKEAAERARALFPAFGLAGYEGAYPDALSGGMRPARSVSAHSHVPGRHPAPRRALRRARRHHPAATCRTGTKTCVASSARQPFS